MLYLNDGTSILLSSIVAYLIIPRDNMGMYDPSCIIYVSGGHALEGYINVREKEKLVNYMTRKGITGEQK